MHARLRRTAHACIRTGCSRAHVAVAAGQRTLSPCVRERSPALCPASQAVSLTSTPWASLAGWAPPPPSALHAHVGTSVGGGLKDHVDT